MELLTANQISYPKGFNGFKWDTNQEAPPKRKNIDFYLKDNLPNTQWLEIRKLFQKFQQGAIPATGYFEGFLYTQYQKKRKYLNYLEQNKKKKELKREISQMEKLNNSIQEQKQVLKDELAYMKIFCYKNSPIKLGCIDRLVNITDLEKQLENVEENDIPRKEFQNLYRSVRSRTKQSLSQNKDKNFNQTFSLTRPLNQQDLNQEDSLSQISHKQLNKYNQDDSFLGDENQTDSPLKNPKSIYKFQKQQQETAKNSKSFYQSMQIKTPSYLKASQKNEFQIKNQKINQDNSQENNNSTLYRTTATSNTFKVAFQQSPLKNQNSVKNQEKVKDSAIKIINNYSNISANQSDTIFNNKGLQIEKNKELQKNSQRSKISNQNSNYKAVKDSLNSDQIIQMQNLQREMQKQRRKDLCDQIFIKKLGIQKKNQDPLNPNNYSFSSSSKEPSRPSTTYKNNRNRNISLNQIQIYQ